MYLHVRHILFFAMSKIPIHVGCLIAQTMWYDILDHHFLFHLGIEVKFKGAFYSVFICTTHVHELNLVEVANDGLIVGAAVTLSKLSTKLKKLVSTLPAHRTKAFSALLEMLRWFAGQQIRNVAVS